MKTTRQRLTIYAYSVSIAIITMSIHQIIDHGLWPVAGLPMLIAFGIGCWAENSLADMGL